MASCQLWSAPITRPVAAVQEVSAFNVVIKQIAQLCVCVCVCVCGWCVCVCVCVGGWCVCVCVWCGVVCVCVYSYLTVCRLYMNYRRYRMTLQWNIFTQILSMRSVDWIFIVGAPVCRWLDQYVTLGRTFYCLLFKQKVVAAQLLPHFLPHVIPRRGLC